MITDGATINALACIEATQLEELKVFFLSD
jgi:hypothetical protein